MHFSVGRDGMLQDIDKVAPPRLRSGERCPTRRRCLRTPRTHDGWLLLLSASVAASGASARVLHDVFVA